MVKWCNWDFLCTDSWFLESNGKMVQLGFSLINLSVTMTERLRIMALLVLKDVYYLVNEVS